MRLSSRSFCRVRCLQAVANLAMTDFTRRVFIERAFLGVLGAPAALRALRALGGARAEVLRIGILDGSDIDRLDGAQLGLEEARHAAALFGGDVRLTKIPESGAVSFAAIIGDSDGERCARVARTSLVMNVS